MDINENRLRQPPQRVGTQDLIHCRERVVEGALHEHLPKHLRHEHLAPTPILEQARAATGRVLGVVQRADDARLGIAKRSMSFWSNA